jgi:hypothetical protein
MLGNVGVLRLHVRMGLRVLLLHQRWLVTRLGWHWSVLWVTQINFRLLLTRCIGGTAAIVLRAGSFGMELHVYFGFGILLTTGASLCGRSSIDRDWGIDTCIGICG